MAVLPLLLGVLGNAICSQAAAVTARQASSALSTSLFMRRGYQSSTVLNNWVYIDGGEFSYSSNGETVHQYSSTLIAIDLSEDWESSGVQLHSITKPSGAPDLSRGGVWLDEDNQVLYTGFAGYKSGFGDAANQTQGLWQFKPDNSGSGTWTNLNDTADPAFQTQPRPESGLVASGGGAGYVMGGFLRGSNGSYGISGMVSYDFSSKKVQNSTVSILNGGQVGFGGMVYVPNFGEKGVLVAVGGRQFNTQSYYPLSTIQVYDVASDTWYEQETTGDIPERRQEFCMTGAQSNNETYEIFLYAGWMGTIGATAIPYDEAFVLTLPGFHWVKASYNAQRPRHGLSCSYVGGPQVLTIGGLDTTALGTSSVTGYEAPFNTADPYSQGLRIFDLTTMEFSSTYNATPGPYVQSASVQDFYADNDRMPTFSDSGLKSVFAIQNFTDTTIPSTPSSSASPTSAASDGSGSSNHTGAIAGGVVGGAVGLAALGGVLWLVIRARTKGEQTHPFSIAEAPDSNGTQRYEKEADDVSKSPWQQPYGDQNQYHHVAVPLAELPPRETAAAELPGNQDGYK